MKTLSSKLPDAVATNVETETKTDSFLNLASCFCGSIVGPTDLSTNPKYLEGYGESRDSKSGGGDTVPI